MIKPFTVLLSLPLIYTLSVLGAEIQTTEKNHYIVIANRDIKNCQRHAHGQNIYISMPGLADPTGRENASQEIEKALKLGGKYHLLFIINLKALKIMPEDLATMELIVDAIDHPEKKINIIFNNLEDNDMEGLCNLDNLLPISYTIKKQKYNSGTMWFQNGDFLLLEHNNRKFIYDHCASMIINEKQVLRVEWDKYQNLEITLTNKISDIQREISENGTEIVKLKDDLKHWQEVEQKADEELEKPAYTPKPLRNYKRFPRHIVFIGNPGTGKSTLINSLVGKRVAEAGLSLTGITKHLQKIEHDERTLLDTPGLADIENQDQAVLAIQEALKLGWKYRIFFVLNIRDGRIMEPDCDTINRVMKAIDNDEKTYHVVINKIDAIEREEIFNNNANYEEFCRILKSKLLHQPASITAIDLDNDVRRKVRDFVKLSDQERQFFLKKASGFRLSANQVGSIVTPAAELSEIQAREAKLQSELAEQQKKLDYLQGLEKARKSDKNYMRFSELEFSPWEFDWLIGS